MCGLMIYAISVNIILAVHAKQEVVTEYTKHLGKVIHE